MRLCKNCSVYSVQFNHSVVSDSLWPHELQHARLPCPSPAPRACSNSYPSSRWCHPTTSSPVKRWKWKLLSCVRLYSPWNSLGQNTGVVSLSFLQGIFPTQGLNPGLLHCRQFLYHLSHKGNPRILEWVAYPFYSRSSQPRNWTGVSCIAGGFYTKWAIREALCIKSEINNGHLPFI